MPWSERYLENWTVFSVSQVVYTAALAAPELLNGGVCAKPEV